MTSIEQWNGVLHVPVAVRQNRHALKNQVRNGVLDARIEEEVNDLLDHAECLYPDRYHRAKKNPHLQRMKHELLRLPSKFSIAARQVMAGFAEPSFVTLEYRLPDAPAQKKAELIQTDTEVGPYWRRWLDGKAAAEAGATPLFVSGVTLRLADAADSYLARTTTYAGRGPLKGFFSFNLGSALIAGDGNDKTQLLNCATMAAMMAQAMPGHLDAALAALSFPTDRKEINAALRWAYAPAWYNHLEKARHTLFDQAAPSVASGASMTSLLWYKDNLLIIQKGLNSVCLVGSRGIMRSIEPSKRPVGLALNILAEKGYSADLHNCLAMARCRKGLFTADVEGKIEASVYWMPLEKLKGHSLILSSVAMRDTLSESDLIAAGKERDPESVAKNILGQLRKSDMVGEISVSVLAFEGIASEGSAL